MRSSFRDSLMNSSADSVGERRTVIVERHNGSFGFTLQSYGIYYREETNVEIITYVDYVDPNGHAYKAGLRPGDVIITINGQDVERTDHTTLVTIIQSCPDRIRMVVVFENCIRKVELHTKYIRLTQLLEIKAREYQEVCSSERAFITRLNKTRAPGSYHTIHHTLQLVMPHDHMTSTSTVGTYSSKSLPRTNQQEALQLCEQMSSTGSSGQINQCCGNVKRRSYLCIGKAPDCDCCFRPEGGKGSQPETPKHYAHQQKRETKLPRPRSVHLSCYKNPADVASDERYLINQADRNNCKVYAGYGFGYDFPCHKNYNQSGLLNMALEATPQRHAVSCNAGAHKSAEDLTLSNQFQNKCRTSNRTPHSLKPQVVCSSCSKSSLPVQRSSLTFQTQCSATESAQTQQTGPQHTSPQHLDSISFYNRPSHPVNSSTSSRVPESLLHYVQPYHQQYHHHPRSNRHDHHHQQKIHHLAHQHQHTHQEHPTHQTHNQCASLRGSSNHNNDEGGFDEARRFRTLPVSIAKKTGWNL